MHTLRSIAALLAWPAIVLAVAASTGCASRAPARQAPASTVQRAPDLYVYIADLGPEMPATDQPATDPRAAFDALPEAEQLAMTARAQRDAEAACSPRAEYESDLWWECVLTITGERCTAEGWCE